MNYKYLILSLFLIVGIFFAGCTQQMDAEEIAKKMQEKYESMKSMEADVLITMNMMGQTKTMQYKYAFEKPNKFYMENDDVLIVCDGKTYYVYDKKKNQYTMVEIKGEENNLFNPDYGKLIKSMLEKFNVSYLGEENYDGRKCYVLELISKENPEEKMKMYVDEEYWQPLKIEMDGMTIEYKDVKFNVDIPDDKFKFVPPEGAKLMSSGKMAMSKNIDEVQKDVSFKILVPKYTAGLELQNAMATKQNANNEESEAVILSYGDNGELAIAESKDNKPLMIPENDSNAITLKNGVKALISDSGDMKMLIFQYNGIKVIVMGKLDKDELIKIANSMIE
ncbi:outer membrane lipoprotein carrier protein LolA [Methanocaldococcus sp. FS406-22]|uniref:outer membrane lipoprotein-sorting protein n=1 Tax=Methanocaldococcus sp. (strain FS406-22) TaxID=644281 RepID=UPI0001BF1E08|nr:outer membrane lipoprotein-sorting protein [Methanocaldococcus sp. FS406-22]ADC70166.1 outer membrane lipoprotein carrier protein LolA [Methanocaldococcus sp. FS406-22]